MSSDEHDVWEEVETLEKQVSDISSMWADQCTETKKLEAENDRLKENAFSAERIEERYRADNVRLEAENAELKQQVAILRNAITKQVMQNPKYGINVYELREALAATEKGELG